MKSHLNRKNLAAARVFLAGSIFFGMALPLFGEAAILQNFRIGNRHPSVRELQQILNLDPETRLAASGPGSPGNETEYFGPITYSAVRRFQQKYSAEILAPIGLTAPTGFVGPQTRRILNLLALAPSPTPSPFQFQSKKPTITAVTPGTVTQSPTALTITGTNFTPLGNTILISSEPLRAYANLMSANNKIEINFRASAVENLKAQISAKISPEDYDTAAKLAAENIVERLPDEKNSRFPTTVRVKNINGESAPFTIYIDATAILLAK